jgi:hypothetical protein
MKIFLSWFIPGCAVIVIAAGTALSLPSVRAKLQSNRLIYLCNTHRYADALGQYQQLVLKYPEVTGILPKFIHDTFMDARKHYRVVNKANLAKSDAISMLEFSEMIDELAPRARKLRLELAVKANQPSESDVLKAARSILEHDGFDLDAIWWVIRMQYRESTPLKIPPELNPFQEKIESFELSGSNSGHDPEIRLAWLQALSAITRENWGLAVNHFEAMGLHGGEMPPYQMAYSHALIESGQPESAAWILNHFLRKYPRSTLALQYLVKAWLASGQYPWAAYAYHRLEKLNPAALETTIEEIVQPFGHADRDLMTRLSHLFVQPESPYFQDLEYWNWLMLIIRQETIKTLNLDSLKDLTINRPDLACASPARIAMQIQYSISENRKDLLDACLKALESIRHPWKEEYLVSLNRISQWIENREKVDQLSLPGGKKILDMLLNQNSTERKKLQTPSQSCFMVLTAQGYDDQDRGTWPVVQLDTGVHGSHTAYLPQSRRNFMALVLPLNPGTKTNRKNLELKISLLNAEPEGNSRTGIYLGEMISF